MALAETRGGGAGTCYEVLGELDDAMRDSLLPEHRYFTLGGIPTAALLHPYSVIDLASKEVLPPRESDLPLRRENGSRRDVDLQINTVLSAEDVVAIRTNSVEAISDSLVVSIFGFDEHKPVATPAKRLKRNLTAFLSNRTQTQDENGVLRYELYPIEQEVQPESYEPWTLVLPTGARLPMLHPAGHMLAYRMCSISGPRFKDREKCQAMERRIEPLFREEIEEGAFREWKIFADTIMKLRNGQLYLWPNLDPEVVQGELGFFWLKSHALSFLERQEKLISLAQTEGPVERIANIFIRAK